MNSVSLNINDPNYRENYGGYVIRRDAHGPKHIPTAQERIIFCSQKRQFIENTRNGEAKFFPEYADNYNQIFVNCMKAWIDRGANANGMVFNFQYPVGAAKGKETKQVQLYYQETGGHIRPKE